MDSTTTVTPKQASELLQSNSDYLLVDVRSPGEFQSVHAVNARNIPLERLSDDTTLDSLRGHTIVCICQKGARGERAAQALRAAGFQNTTNVQGGTDQWVKEGLPITRGSGAISMERQVRITAGILVLLGTVLGIAINPLFLALPIFVGGGLTYSGISDSCGMAVILSQCPWNR